MLLFVIDKWRIEVGKQRMLFVFFAKQGIAERNFPIYAQGLVSNANAAVGLGVIEIGKWLHCLILQNHERNLVE